MAHSSQNVPPLKLVLYSMLLIFLLFTCIALIKDSINTQDLKTSFHEAMECQSLKYEEELIRGLEPLVSEEPLEVWEGLGKEEKNIKYLTTMIDLGPKKRFIYIDLGSREYQSSIGTWFEKQYPKQDKPFEIYAVEADKTFHHEYVSRKGLTLLPYAAWIRNETVVFGSKPIIVNDKVWRLRPFGRIEGEKAQKDKLSAVTKVQAFDFIDWLKRTVGPTDFVVVKMDVEGTEIKLIQELIDRGAICLIDELFMECHFDRYVKCCSGERINRFNYTYKQCFDLFSKLRNSGCVVHQWW